MIPRGYASLAEYYREHREVLLLSMELGCTPNEAKLLLHDRARARRRTCGTRAPEQPADSDFERTLRRAQGDRSMETGNFRDWEAPWMMRD